MQVRITFLLLVLIQITFSACPDYYVEIKPNVNAVEVRSWIGGSPSSTRINTWNEDSLLYRLKVDYNKHNTMIIAHVDSVITIDTIGGNGWGIDSVIFVVDSVIKGTINFDRIGFLHTKSDTSGSFISIKDLKFISFFTYDTIPALLGMADPSPCYTKFGGIGQGYFIIEDTIQNRGFNAILGVRTTLNDLLISLAQSDPDRYFLRIKVDSITIGSLKDSIIIESSLKYSLDSTLMCGIGSCYWSIVTRTDTIFTNRLMRILQLSSTLTYSLFDSQNDSFQIDAKFYYYDSLRKNRLSEVLNSKVNGILATRSSTDNKLSFQIFVDYDIVKNGSNICVLLFGSKDSVDMQVVSNDEIIMISPSVNVSAKKVTAYRTVKSLDNNRVLLNGRSVQFSNKLKTSTNIVINNKRKLLKYR